jgi:periplasmic protein TonB
MFENALIESKRSKGSRGRLLTLPVAAGIHAAALATLMVAQLWAVEAVPEPERTVAVYLAPQAPPPPPPPPPRGSRTLAAPVTRQPLVQPIEVPSELPPPSTGSRTGVEFSMETGNGTGDEEGGAEDGPEGGVPGLGPPPLPEVEAPVRLTSVMEAPERIAGPDPVYPEAARKARREGVVILEAIIERDGSVGAVRVLLDRVGFGTGEAAVSAVQQWRYRPAMFNDRSLAVVMTITVTFRLN